MADEPYRGPDAATAQSTPKRSPGRRGNAADLTDLRTELEELRRRVQQNDDEIDAIQITAAQTSQAAERSPLAVLRSPAVLISLLSLLLAFGTTFLSSARLDADREHAARVELTGYIERLTDIPRLQAEVAQQHPGSSAGNLVAELNAQMQSLAYQARNVMRTIPDQVATVEYMAVGYALQSIGALDDASELYALGLTRAAGTSDRIFALRSLAGVRFIERDFAVGRDFYQQARGAYGDETGAAELVVANDNAQTELLWANAEFGAGFCQEAARHATAASQILAAEPLPNLTAPLQQLQAAITACVPRVSPSPNPT